MEVAEAEEVVAAAEIALNGRDGRPSMPWDNAVCSLLGSVVPMDRLVFLNS